MNSSISNAIQTRVFPLFSFNRSEIQKRAYPLVQKEQIQFTLVFLPMSSFLVVIYLGFEIFLEPDLLKPFLVLRLGYAFIAMSLFFLTLKTEYAKKNIAYIAYFAYFLLITIEWIMLYHVEHFFAYTIGYLAVYLAVCTLMPFHPLFITSMFPVVAVISMILVPQLNLDENTILLSFFNTVTVWVITGIFAYVRFKSLCTNSVLQVQQEKALFDLKSSQKQLVEKEKLASLGQIVAGVAHEMNTPIYNISGSSDSLSSEVDHLMDDLKEIKIEKSIFEDYQFAIKSFIKIIKDNCDTLSKLIDSFKQVSVDQTLQKNKIFEFKNIINNILQMLNHKIRVKNIKIEKQVDNISYHGDPSIFYQIITNLIDNAIMHAYDDNGGAIKIILRSTEDKIEMKFIDFGKGINQSILPKIFDPFFTTGGLSGKGTGLGLNILYNLVTQELSGTIACESIPNKGTTFIISFPKKNDHDIAVGDVK